MIEYLHESRFWMPSIQMIVAKVASLPSPCCKCKLFWWWDQGLRRLGWRRKVRNVARTTCSTKRRRRPVEQIFILIPVKTISEAGHFRKIDNVQISKRFIINMIFCLAVLFPHTTKMVLRFVPAYRPSSSFSIKNFAAYFMLLKLSRRNVVAQF